MIGRAAVEPPDRPSSIVYDSDLDRSQPIKTPAMSENENENQSHFRGDSAASFQRSKMKMKWDYQSRVFLTKNYEQLARGQPILPASVPASALPLSHGSQRSVSPGPLKGEDSRPPFIAWTGKKLEDYEFSYPRISGNPAECGVTPLHSLTGRSTEKIRHARSDSKLPLIFSQHKEKENANHGEKPQSARADSKKKYGAPSAFAARKEYEEARKKLELEERKRQQLEEEERKRNVHIPGKKARSLLRRKKKQEQQTYRGKVRAQIVQDDAGSFGADQFAMSFDNEDGFYDSIRRSYLDRTNPERMFPERNVRELAAQPLTAVELQQMDFELLGQGISSPAASEDERPDDERNRIVVAYADHNNADDAGEEDANGERGGKNRGVLFERNASAMNEIGNHRTAPVADEQDEGNDDASSVTSSEPFVFEESGPSVSFQSRATVNSDYAYDVEGRGTMDADGNGRNEVSVLELPVGELPHRVSPSSMPVLVPHPNADYAPSALEELFPALLEMHIEEQHFAHLVSSRLVASLTKKVVSLFDWTKHTVLDMCVYPAVQQAEYKANHRDQECQCEYTRVEYVDSMFIDTESSAMSFSEDWDDRSSVSSASASNSRSVAYGHTPYPTPPAQPSPARPRPRTYDGAFSRISGSTVGIETPSGRVTSTPAASQSRLSALREEEGLPLSESHLDFGETQSVALCKSDDLSEATAETPLVIIPVWDSSKAAAPVTPIARRSLPRCRKPVPCSPDFASIPATLESKRSMEQKREELLMKAAATGESALMSPRPPTTPKIEEDAATWRQFRAGKPGPVSAFDARCFPYYSAKELVDPERSRNPEMEWLKLRLLSKRP
eukprot:ANDGO_01254.mRNA.1 hypothetical protein